jgi:2-polyprenyl-3-methyl-5-hydroxy-6-metoxy-1,4-benzoquinol methylase
VDREKFILDCARGKTVLDIGMGGHLDDSAVIEHYLTLDLTQTIHGKLSKVAGRLDGIDINVKPLEAMRKAVPGFYAFCDVCSSDFASVLGDRRYDLIVFGDTIEHLDDFRSALRNLRSVLRKDGILLISTVNAYSFESIIKLLFRYESVHDEHTAYFSYSTLRRLLAMNQLEIVDFQYCMPLHLKRLDSFAHRISYHVSRLFVRVFPQYSLGVVALTKPVVATGVEASA